MRAISVIENEEVIRKILKHLGLWDINPPYFWRVKARPPPKPVPVKTPEFHIDYSDSQLPLSDAYLYVDPEYPEVYPS